MGHAQEKEEKGRRGRAAAVWAVGERKKREEGGCGPGCQGGKRRKGEEGNGCLGWAQRKEKREKQTIAFEFEHGI
jgi:hypothetical protein